MSDDDVFGSPQLPDATALFEQVAESASQGYKDMVNHAANNIMNRQLGSKKVPMKDVLTEWKTAKEMDDVGWLTQQLIDEGNDTVEKLIKAAMDREHRLRNG